MPKKFLFHKKILKNDFESRAELPPFSAEWISLVAPSFSALPSAPPALSTDGQRGSRRFLEFPESPRVWIWGHEKRRGALRYALIGAQEPR